VSPASSVYEFGSFRLDSAERLLLRAGQPVPVTPKAFDLLVYLVDHAGRLVTKQTLMSALWPDSFVEEANLTFTVSALRKALGDPDPRVPLRRPCHQRSGCLGGQCADARTGRQWRAPVLGVDRWRSVVERRGRRRLCGLEFEADTAFRVTRDRPPDSHRPCRPRASRSGSGHCSISQRCAAGVRRETTWSPATVRPRARPSREQTARGHGRRVGAVLLTR
jgi:hypothetical protein